MATRKKTDEATEILIEPVEIGCVRVLLYGRTPLILNRLSEKAKHELLLPAGRKNSAERAQSLKHNPLAEFRDAPHRIEDPTAPTLLALPSTAIKGAIRDAALDIRGASKAQIGRLTSITQPMLPVWGIPEIFASTVRMADIARTPDIRTRVIVPEWAMAVEVRFVKPQLRAQSVVNLLSAAGLIQGAGDWRPSKGSGSYGQFEIVNEDHEGFLRLVDKAGRAAQQAAMDDPESFDEETGELLSWFDVEIRRRGIRAA